MAKIVGSELTEELEHRLHPAAVDQYADQVILIHTIDEGGWAHPAVLSHFEVVAKDSKNVRLATYTDSHTTANMRRSGKVTISLFDEKAIYYVKGIASEVRRHMRSAPHNSMINVWVEQVSADQADPELEPGAYIASGIRCVNPHIDSERPRYDAILNELAV